MWGYIQWMRLNWDEICGPFTTGAVAQMCRERGYAQDALTPERVQRLADEINALVAELGAARRDAMERFDALDGGPDAAKPPL